MNVRKGGIARFARKGVPRWAKLITSPAQPRAVAFHVFSEFDRRHSASPEMGMWPLKQFRESVVRALVAGVLLVAPIYLAILLLLKAMKSVAGVVRPLARL